MNSRAVIQLFVPASALLLLACTPALAAGRSIVGEWAPDPRRCQPIDGALKIAPLGMAGDEFSCDFKSVSREGDVVTWRGFCSAPRKAATVVASLRGEVLSVRVNGDSIGSYRRCRPGSGNAA
ncbi:hypothetical protein [Methylobacterium aquaticum]|uniref:hypothetical protein n=1 Tax=Methylobacterium aquaticum TaxID=270351 RepID=UPI001FED79E0|nr:hypothetical protein [Methylobacterium aquaticum]